MTEPKFQIGDLVAVCCYPHPRPVVIPEAVVTDRLFVVPGSHYLMGPNGIQLTNGGWFYSTTGTRIRHHEKYLRPIRPDEYASEPVSESKELSV